MLTYNGYYKQTYGLAMGSPPAPPLANGWLSRYDSVIGQDSKVYYRYMDDIIRDIKKNSIDAKLTEINNLHQSLKFTNERAIEGKIPRSLIC